MRLRSWHTVKYLGRSPKVVLRLSICEPGPYFEKVVERWYNAEALIGKPRPSGRFIPGWSSDLFREYVLIAGKPPRRDHVALSNLKKLLLIGSVETVTTDREQRHLDPLLHYSVVRRLSRGTT